MRRPRVLAVLLLALLLAVGARRLDVHPVTYRADEAETAGGAEHAVRSADVLIVVDAAAVAATGGRSFEACDWSYGWWNLAEQELGRFAVAPPDLGRGLPERRVVVVTRSALRSARDAVPALRAFVASGGVLAVEQPDEPWAALTRATTGRVTTEPLVLTGADRETAAELAAVPRVAGAFRTLVPKGEVRVLATSGGAPVATLAAHGRGAVLALGIDVGRAVTALQQGLPDPEGFRVSNRHPATLTAHLQASDLVADGGLLGATVPVADVLERVVVRLLEAHGPLPRWWTHPDAAPGSYAATHDEEAMGDAAAWMADAERSWGRAGSDFVVAARRLTPRGAARMGGAGRTLGLHHVDDLALDAPRHEVGLGPFRPLVRPWTLAEQAAAFERLTGRRPRSNRNHYLLWDEGYARPFRRMAAAGIEIDTTYGPDMGTAGYLFGTGLPFRALDENGLPLPVHELPFQTAEDLGGADRAFVWRLLRESAERHHQTVTTLFHPNVFAWRPDAALYATWRDAFAEAERLGLHVTDVETFVDGLRARARSPLRSSWAAGVLEVRADALHDGATLAVPAVWDGRPADVSVDGRAATARRVEGAGGPLLLVVLASGSRSVRVAYPEIVR